jgi:hypothetical protein
MIIIYLLWANWNCVDRSAWILNQLAEADLRKADEYCQAMFDGLRCLHSSSTNVVEDSVSLPRPIHTPQWTSRSIYARKKTLKQRTFLRKYACSVEAEWWAINIREQEPLYVRSMLCFCIYYIYMALSYRTDAFILLCTDCLQCFVLYSTASLLLQNVIMPYTLVQN